MHPLDDLSDELIRELKSAGWIPGRPRRDKEGFFVRTEKNVAITDDSWKEFVETFNPGVEPLSADILSRLAPARLILAELWKIAIPRFETYLVHFDPIDGISDADTIRLLSTHVSDVLIPIGEIRSEAILLFGASGRYFAMGYVGAGVYFFGESFAVAIDQIMRRKFLWPVYFEPEVSWHLRLEGLQRDDPGVYIPPHADQ